MEEELVTGYVTESDSSAVCCVPRCRTHKRYQYSCVHSKGAIIVIIWGALVFTVVTTNVYFNSSFFRDETNFELPKSLIAVSSLYILFYPILGYFGEKWTRYKVILFGSGILVVGYISRFFVIPISIALTEFLLSETTSTILTSLLWIVFSFPLYLGFGLFQSNVIQFGCDQLLFAPSHELSSFIRWFIGMQYPFYTINNILLAIVSYYSPTSTFYILMISFCLTVLATLIALLLGCFAKSSLYTGPSNYSNPVKLIWRVMRYAWKHKQPVRRSAFTYGEPPPSRLDLGKERYGGPFTTEEVEDVKSFWYIYAIILALYGYSLRDTSSGISYQYLKAKQGSLSFMEHFLLMFPDIITLCILSVGIPFFQFVIVPFFSRYIPNMLKRIWTGLMLILVEMFVITIVTFTFNKSVMRNDNYTNVCLNDNDNISSIRNDIVEGAWPFYVLLIPQVLNGIGALIYYVTVIEFIAAQGPRQMQGLLITLWYMFMWAYLASQAMSTSSIGCHWEYYAVKTGLVLTSLICYTIAAYKYKYRQRDELSDVNERVIITEYESRQLDRQELESTDNPTFTIYSN